MRVVGKGRNRGIGLGKKAPFLKAVHATQFKDSIILINSQTEERCPEIKNAAQFPKQELAVALAPGRGRRHRRICGRPPASDAAPAGGEEDVQDAVPVDVREHHALAGALEVPGSGDAVRVCGPRRISGAAPPRRRARAVTYALPGVCVRRSSAPGNRYGAAASIIVAFGVYYAMKPPSNRCTRVVLTAACGPASARWHRTAGPRRCSACNGAAPRNLLDSNGGMQGA